MVWRRVTPTNHFQYERCYKFFNFLLISIIFNKTSMYKLIKIILWTDAVGKKRKWARLGAWRGTRTFDDSRGKWVLLKIYLIHKLLIISYWIFFYISSYSIKTYIFRHSSALLISQLTVLLLLEEKLIIVFIIPIILWITFITWIKIQIRKKNHTGLCNRLMYNLFINIITWTLLMQLSKCTEMFFESFFFNTMYISSSPAPPLSKQLTRRSSNLKGIIYNKN